MTNQSFDLQTAMTLSAAANRAFSLLDSLDAHRDELAFYALRDLLIDRDAQPLSHSADDAPAPTYDYLRSLLADIDARIAYPHDESARQRLSMLLLDNSLCPMHAIDYAICFDDDTDECATIRAYFPSHDT
jgi:hypothetical protein